MYYHYPDLYGVDFPMDQFVARALDKSMVGGSTFPTARAHTACRLACN